MGDSFEAQATRQLDGLFRDMAPVRAMQAAITGFEDDRLHLHAPLAANVNDKGSAFGGSLASLMTLAGWGLVVLGLQRGGHDAEVFVADSRVHYRRPLHSMLQAQAELAHGETWEPFLSTLGRRGRARIRLQARILLPEGGVAADMTARYVAIARG